MFLIFHCQHSYSNRDFRLEKNRLLKHMYIVEKVKAQVVEATQKIGKAISLPQDGQESWRMKKLNIRHACEAVSICQTCYRYEPKLFDRKQAVIFSGFHAASYTMPPVPHRYGRKQGRFSDSHSVRG